MDTEQIPSPSNARWEQGNQYGSLIGNRGLFWGGSFSSLALTHNDHFVEIVLMKSPYDRNSAKKAQTLMRPNQQVRLLFIGTFGHLSRA